MEVANLELRVSSKKAVEESKKAEQALHNAGAASERAARRGTRAFDGMGGALRVVRRLALTLAATLGIMHAVQVFGNFERTMQGVRAVTSATDDQFARMQKTARSLGAVTQFSATQAAEGMQFLGMAGFNTDQIVSAIPGTLNLAAAGLIDLGSAADIASNVLQTFRLRAEQMDRVADVMAKTTSISNTNFLQLGDALSYAGTVAASLKIDMETTAAAIGVLSNVGVQSTRAGTTLARVMISLINPTKKAQEALKSYGLTFDDISPATNDFITIIQRLKDAQMSMTDAAQIFGQRGIIGYLALTDNLDQFRELEVRIRDSKGAAEEMAKIRMDNLPGDFLLLRSAIEEVILATSQEGGLGQNLRELTQGATHMVVSLNENFASFGAAFVMTWRDILNPVDHAFEFLESGFNTFQFVGEKAIKLVEVAFMTTFELIQTVFARMLNSIISGIAGMAGKIGMALAKIPGMGDARKAAFGVQFGLAAARMQEGNAAGTAAAGAAELEAIQRRRAQANIDIGQRAMDRRAGRDAAADAALSGLTVGDVTMANAETKALQRITEEIENEAGAMNGLNAQAILVDKSFVQLRTDWAALQDEIVDSEFISMATVEEVQAKLDMIDLHHQELQRRFEEGSVSIRNSLIFGFQEAVDSWGTLSQRAAGVTNTLANSIDQNLTDSLMSVIDGTMSVEEAFSRMAEAIIQDLIRVMIQQLIVRSIMQGLGGLGGAGAATTTTATTMHSGGVVGSTAYDRTVGSGWFRGASRYQTGGMAGDEVGIVAHRGEVIVNEQQFGALMGGMGSGRQQKVEVVNLVDPRMVDERLAANPGAVLNVISKNRTQVRAALGIQGAA